MIIIKTTTDHYEQITQAIESIDRLNELVTVVTDASEIDENSKLIVVENSTIKTSLDWFDTEPPYVFPIVALSTANLYALLFYKLGNPQKAFEFLSEENKLYNHLLIATHLQGGYEISEKMYAQIDTLHNQCVVLHYGNYTHDFDAKALKQLYEKAIAKAEDDEIKKFTSKHYINFLLDNNAYEEAEQFVRSLLKETLSTKVRNALNIQLASALKAQLQMPYESKKLEEIATLLQEGIRCYENRNLKISAGLLLIEASEVANFQGDFPVSKELINKAILYFKEEDIPVFLGEAGLRKATLLYTWSKNGHPQYFKSAISAFQDVLKIFKRDTHPQKFAEVHHHLALMYAEMPVSLEEKPLWAAFCASSFKEALKFYTKKTYPYEYAMVNHNYATALMDFPEAKLHNNLEKACGMFEEALAIRVAKNYPFERALTLINQLELYWLMHNESSEEEAKKYRAMVEKANEIKQLITDPALIEKANEHLEELKKLKKNLN